MRTRSGLSAVPAVSAWIAMTMLAACGTLGGGPGTGDERRAEQARQAQAAQDDEDDEDDDCELLTVRRGEAAQLVEEKTPEMADPFYLLGAERELLEAFEVDEEEEEDCLIAFGLQSAGGGLAPAAFGSTIPGGVIAAAAAVVAAGVGLGVLAGGGGGGTTSTPSTQ